MYSVNCRKVWGITWVSPSDILRITNEQCKSLQLGVIKSVHPNSVVCREWQRLSFSLDWELAQNYYI